MGPLRNPNRVLREPLKDPFSTIDVLCLFVDSEMSIGQMSVSQMSVGLMFDSQMFVGKSVSQMSVGQTSVSQMSVSLTFIIQMSA
jgi:hypothetical protein